MKKFFVSNVACKEEGVNIGISPGRFDTKQLILSAIAVLAYSTSDTVVQFIRSINREDLAKCQLFINDDFTSLFPAIPSYHDIEAAWKNNSEKILRAKYLNDSENIKTIANSVLDKICNLEAIDCFMDLYYSNYNYTDSFESALETTIRFVERAIRDSINESMYYCTVKAYVKEANSNFITLPIYIQGWRNILKLIPGSENIEYAILPDGNNDMLVVEAFDKGIVLKKYVKGMNNVIYSGRFFVKASDMETAIRIIQRLPSAINTQKTNYA